MSPHSASMNRQGTRFCGIPPAPRRSFIIGASSMSTFIGIDVSQGFLGVFLRPENRTVRVSNDPAGHRQLLAALPAPGDIGRVVLEATGGLEMPVAAALAAAG